MTKNFTLNNAFNIVTTRFMNTFRNKIFRYALENCFKIGTCDNLVSDSKQDILFKVLRSFF